ncbi:helix-turn-helix transcriptional regulator [Microbacterium ureisolvens]|uniref:Helix-turn-helix domain-containing protein n=1 Tax=Microbacterium ureisolvens TaxID=2781186 RepID=A0ABS7I0Q5_9MICO|nr:helix-turn-helix domain-containing protein [Microbacterium ureisolvens]MBW9110174.1 helix-turn-helix domain-containing protein [Microbacterium ureisolvens]
MSTDQHDQRPWSTFGPLLTSSDDAPGTLVRLLRDRFVHDPLRAAHVVAMSEDNQSKFGSGGAASRLLTTEEVAEYLQIPARTIEDWRHRGYGPKYARMGKRVRYRQAAVDAWLAEIEAA